MATTTADTARRLLERTGEHPVLSIYYDLDPTTFALADARSSEIHSLVDEAAGEIERAAGQFTHEDHITLREDLERIERFLQSDEVPVSGTRALALFASGQDDLFEVVPLHEPAARRVVISRRPYVEPMVRAAGGDADGDPWLVVLVDRSSARFAEGSVHRLQEIGDLDDDVHGQHQQGGWSQARYERSVDQEADDHLRHVCQEIHGHHKQGRFNTLVLSGTAETVARVRELLHPDVLPALLDQNPELDMSATGEEQIREAALGLLEERRARREREVLQRLTEALARAASSDEIPDRATSGLEPTLEALTERRVETLLLSPDFHAPGGRCPSCGMLIAGAAERCPADGTELERHDDIRPAAVEAAIMQDAALTVFNEAPPQAQLRDGIGALLRF